MAEVDTKRAGRNAGDVRSEWAVRTSLDKRAGHQNIAAAIAGRDCMSIPLHKNGTIRIDHRIDLRSGSLLKAHSHSKSRPALNALLLRQSTVQAKQEVFSGCLS